MKVGRLIELLQGIDPELEIQAEVETDSDSRVMTVDGAGTALVDSNGNVFNDPLEDQDREAMEENDIEESDLTRLALIGVSKY